MSPGWANTVGDLLQTRWTLSRSPTLTQAGNTDQACLHSSEAGRPLGKPTPSFCGLSLPHHRCPCLSPLALVILKDCPVLRTICRGLREGSTRSLSQTGNKSIIIIISIVKTTSVGCHAPNLPQHYRNTSHILILPFQRQMPVQ